MSDLKSRFQFCWNSSDQLAMKPEGDPEWKLVQMKDCHTLLEGELVSVEVVEIYEIAEKQGVQMEAGFPQPLGK